MTRPTALVIGETTFPFHSFDEKAPAFVRALDVDETTVTVTTDRDELVAPDADVVIDYTTDSTLSDDQQDGLLGFVRDGGGYVGVHCASDLTSVAPEDPDDVIDHVDEPIPEFRDLLGGHFLDHPENAEFGVKVVADHPVTDGVSDFRVYDEPYRLDVDEDRVTVLVRMDHPEMEGTPVVWVREYGDGRVCYVSLGHTDEAFDHPEFGRLLGNAVAWTSHRSD